MKAVLDSNVLISAFLFFDHDAVPARLLRLFAHKRFVLCACPAILQEVEGALLRDRRTPERYGYTSERVALFCSTLAADARVVDPLPLSGVTRAPTTTLSWSVRLRRRLIASSRATTIFALLRSTGTFPSTRRGPSSPVSKRFEAMG